MIVCWWPTEVILGLLGEIKCCHRQSSKTRDLGSVKHCSCIILQRMKLKLTRRTNYKSVSILCYIVVLAVGMNHNIYLISTDKMPPDIISIGQNVTDFDTNSWAIYCSYILGKSMDLVTLLIHMIILLLGGNDICHPLPCNALLRKRVTSSRYYYRYLHASPCKLTSSFGCRQIKSKQSSTLIFLVIIGRDRSYLWSHIYFRFLPSDSIIFCLFYGEVQWTYFFGLMLVLSIIRRTFIVIFRIS